MRGRPASSSGRGTGSIRRPASSTISASRASRIRAPSGGVKAVTAADGRPTSKSRNRVSSAGRSIPFSYTCTCSGRPLSASTQTSTRPTDDAPSAGTSRSPSASWPDTVRAPIRASSSSVASDSSRRPSEAGSRSDGTGSANGVDSARVAVARSYSQVQVPHSSR